MAETRISERAVQADNSEIELLRREIAALRRTMQSLQAGQLAPGEEIDSLELPIAAVGTTTPPAKDSSFDPAALAAEERAWLRAEVEHLEDRLALDRPDPTWTDPATREVERRLEHLKFEGTRVIDAQCGDELCRIELASGDESEAFQLLGVIHDLVPSEGGTCWFGDEETGRIAVFAERIDRDES